MYTQAYLKRLEKAELISLFLQQQKLEERQEKPYNKRELLQLYSDQVIDLSPDAILLINYETLFLEGCNQAALSLLELDTRESLALYLDELFQERPVFFELLKELGSALKSHPEVSMEVEFTTSRSNQRWGHMVCKKIDLLENTLLFIRIIDITTIKLAQQLLLESEQRLEEAQQIAQLGSYTFNRQAKGMHAHFSVTFCQIMGIENEEEKSSFNNSYLNYVHIDDRMLVKSKIKQLIKQRKGGSFEHRIIKKNGEEKYLHSIIRLELGDDGKVHKVIGTIQDITEIKQREKELILAKEQAEISKQAKDRFLQVVSHEIRNPLNAIVGISKLLQQSGHTNDQEHIRTLNFSASHLLSIINDILDTAKLQYGKVTLEQIPFSISDQLRQTEDLFRPQLAEKETTLEVVVAEDIPDEVSGDPTRFNQIIFNLISNAVKYTYRGRIKLEVSLIKQVADHFLLEFVVSDSGVGILSKNLEKIFEAFEQDDLRINQQKGGTGLGLYIVKELINLMSGSIRVSSEFGKGTQFAFTLPFSKIRHEDENESHSLGQLQAQFNLKDKRVLYVEDAVYNQLLLKGYVQTWHLSLDLAANVNEAMVLAKENKYDLVLTDYRLPDGSGEDVVDMFKKLDAHYLDIPFIVISAYNLENNGQNLFDDYIQKPINFDKFFYVMRKYLAKEAPGLASKNLVQKNEQTEAPDTLEFLRKNQPVHYQEFVENMENDLLDMQGALIESVSQQSYRAYLQVVHKLSSALKMIHEKDFLCFLEAMEDLPSTQVPKDELIQNINTHFSEIIQRWKAKNVSQ